MHEWGEFRVRIAPWQSAIGYKEGRSGIALTCHTPEARCYVADNPDVEEYVCGGSINKCSWLDVHVGF